MVVLSSQYVWIVVCGGIACFVTAFAIGANDVANTFSAAVGSKALPLWVAILLAAILEIIGATLLGATVTEQIKSNVIDFSHFKTDPAVLCLGMMCALFGAGIWLLLASRVGLPVSTTHSIIGALLGFGLGTGTPQAIHWRSIGFIVLSWFLAPVSSALLGGALFVFLRWFILRRPNSLTRAFWSAPVFMFFVSSSFSLFLVFKNPIVIMTRCRMLDKQGNYVSGYPCKLARFSDAHRRIACCVAVGIALVLTILLSYLVFRVAKTRLTLAAARDREVRRKSSSIPVFAEESMEFEISDSYISNSEFANGCNDPSYAREEDRIPYSYETTEPRIIGLEPGVASVYEKPKERRSSYCLKSLASSTDVEDSSYTATNTKPTWKQKMKSSAQDKWNNMPWFRDVHGEENKNFDEFNVSSGVKGSEMFDPKTEIFFSCCQIISSCLGCLAHSANDTANAIGPFAAILTIYRRGLDTDVNVEWYILMSGGIAMAFGLALLGYRVIQTVGVKLVKITPSRGFSIELGAAWVVLIFSGFGVPLSTTHSAVGSTLGVGLTEPKDEYVPFWEGIKRKPPVLPLINTTRVNWKLFGSIFVSWIGTVVFSCLVSMCLFSFAVYSPTFAKT